MKTWIASQLLQPMSYIIGSNATMVDRGWIYGYESDKCWRQWRSGALSFTTSHEMTYDYHDLWLPHPNPKPYP